MKVCTKCGIEKDESEFGKMKNGKNGLHIYCKQCVAEKSRIFRRKKSLDKEHINKLDHNFKKCGQCGKIKEKTEFHIKKYNSGKIGHVSQCKSCKALYMQNYYKINPPDKNIQMERSKEWYEKNKPALQQNRKEYYQRRRITPEFASYQEKRKNINKIYNHEYNLKNRISINAYKNDYDKKRKKIDANYKLKKQIRTLFRERLKYNSIEKLKPFFEYTGIAYADYVSYFEQNFPVEFSQITEKGKYHIDHIIPCAAYDFNNPDEIKLCWQPENLRIIPAAENISKSDTLDFDLIEKHNIWHLLPESIKVKRSA